MKADHIAMVQSWLASTGKSRIEAAEAASRFLLCDYLKKWEYIIPIELHRLANTLHAEIVRLDGLESEAVLMPKYNGFRIIVNLILGATRYRTSVAHELVHTLFYTDPIECTPNRVISHSNREEQFCFDVARFLLAPREHLKAINIFSENDPDIMFNKLTQTLLLSRPLAARLMLSDYRLATGIGGRWIRSANCWKQIPGSSSASLCLKEAERSKLRIVAKEYLEHPEKRIKNANIVAINEQDQNGVFLLVITKCGAEREQGS